jgi:predicted MPP superfamily phosphohydrolase
VSLALAGHTHGGQVRLPFIGAPVTSSEYGQRFAQGWVHDPVRAYISRGLGVTAIPVRLLCPAELVILDLLPATPA